MVLDKFFFTNLSVEELSPWSHEQFGGFREVHYHNDKKLDTA
jgi:hypothetical protein